MKKCQYIFHDQLKNIEASTYRPLSFRQGISGLSGGQVYAAYLLQANRDIRTIQKQLGHSGRKTRMIYCHCVPVRTVKESKEPARFLIKKAAAGRRNGQ
jgi:integrase